MKKIIDSHLARVINYLLVIFLMASAVTLVLFIKIFYLAFHEYNDRKIQFWHLGNNNTFNIEIIEWRLIISPLILDEWYWAIIFEGLEFLMYILIRISINCWMVLRTSISTYCDFIHLPNFLFNRNHSHELQNILLREQKKKSNKGKFYDRHKKNHNKKREENG